MHGQISSELKHHSAQGASLYPAGTGIKCVSVLYLAYAADGMWLLGAVVFSSFSSAPPE